MPRNGSGSFPAPRPAADGAPVLPSRAPQIVNGLVQTTGWPSVVACLGNWFGKGR